MSKLIQTDDWRLIRGYRQERVFKRVQGHRLCGYQENVACLLCGDGHKAPEIIEHLGRFTHCRHLFAANGGALWLDPQFRDTNFSEADHLIIVRFWLEQFKEAMALKETNRLLLFVHYGCGKGHMHGLALDELLDTLVRARAFVKRELDAYLAAVGGRFKQVKVAGLFHYSDGQRCRTVWVNHEHHRFAHLKLAA